MTDAIEIDGWMGGKEERGKGGKKNERKIDIRH